MQRALHGHFSAEALHLFFYHIKPHSLTLNGGIKSFIKTKNFMPVFCGINAAPIVLVNHYYFMFLNPAVYHYNRFAAGFAVFNAIEDEVKKDAV